MLYVYNASATDQCEDAWEWETDKIFVEIKKQQHLYHNIFTQTTSKLLKSLHPFQMGIKTLPHTSTGSEE